MRIRLVTIGTFLKHQRFLEIPFGVALHAVHLGVLAQQWKFRFGMVKRAIQPGRHNPVPAVGAVAGLAGSRKAATVRV